MVTLKDKEGNGWLTSDYLFLEQNRMFNIIIAISLGYMIYDEINFRFFFRNFGSDSMDYQMSLHHYLGILYYSSSMVTGFAAPNITGVALICEISTILLNLRWLQPSNKTCCFKFLSYSFVICFTVLRMIGFPYLFIFSVANIVGIWKRVSTIRKIFGVIYLIICLAFIGLMCFWYYQIIHSLLKMIGVIKKKKEDPKGIEEPLINEEKTTDETQDNTKVEQA